jgi:hypothetical protein
VAIVGMGASMRGAVSQEKGSVLYIGAVVAFNEAVRDEKREPCCSVSGAEANAGDGTQAGVKMVEQLGGLLSGKGLACSKSGSSS